ncbi:MAG: phosphonate metabolism transcriptional regulator PhnF [Hyphomicrobiaceae bacterium]|nr:phosphonate metabolism transcriptional regulator PhnF [Hyphomicrobiaceae bacterium]
MMLSRGTGVTVWRQIAEAIEADISAGRFAAGSRLPVEAELAARFGVNRHTLRRAIEALAERGLVRAVQGSGTYVEASPLAYPIGARTRFSEIVAGQAREPAARLLHASTVIPDDAIAADLGLAPNAPTVRILAANMVDAVPVSWVDMHFPADRCAGIAEHYAKSRSVTAALAACGIPDYRRAWTRIGAAIADAIDAERLDLAAGRPLLVVDSVNHDTAGRPIQRTRSRMASDRMRLTISD